MHETHAIIQKNDLNVSRLTVKIPKTYYMEQSKKIIPFYIPPSKKCVFVWRGRELFSHLF